MNQHSLDYIKNTDLKKLLYGPVEQLDQQISYFQKNAQRLIGQTYKGETIYPVLITYGGFPTMAPVGPGTTYGGQNPPVGFELYRGSIRREGDPESVDYELNAGTDELGPGARSFEDTNVQRVIPYFYSLQAVGEETTTEGPAGTVAGVRLKSNRVYTQTYDPALLKREPGDELSEARVVPNPYTLTSDQDVRWPGNRDQIGFLGIPGNCTIRIYTESGQLVEEIGHDDGSGDEYWDLTTSSNQLIVSGIYGVVIMDNETGAQRVIKFVVIR